MTDDENLEIKVIKSFKITPFTKLLSSIHAILGFIAAILLLIILVVLEFTSSVPQYGLFKIVEGFGVSLIIVYPIAAFFITMALSFFTALIYNALSNLFGGIELELNGDNLTRIPEVSFALMLSSIEAIMAFIAGVFATAMIIPAITLGSGITLALTNEFTNIFRVSKGFGLTNVGITTLANQEFILGVLLIIGLPIIVFVFGFIVQALFAIFYNYIVARVVKIKLKFEPIRGTLNELKSVPVLPVALAVASIFVISGFITGFINLITFHGTIMQDIVTVIKPPFGNFVRYFIAVALTAIIYNFLATRIGGIKVDLR